MAKYLSGELHSNGETVALDNPADAKALRAAFVGKWFKTSDGATEYGISTEASQFVKLTIDTTPITLTKPNCDNYDDCPSTTDEPETGESDEETQPPRE